MYIMFAPTTNDKTNVCQSTSLVNTQKIVILDIENSVMKVIFY